MKARRLQPFVCCFTLLVMCVVPCLAGEVAVLKNGFAIKHDYRVGGDLYSLKLKGRSWITADKFQIVRIESELVNPIPQIRLAGEHQVVEYGPVPFQKRNMQLWLPQSAEIYLDFRRHRYYRKHSFDHYMRPSV